LENGKIDDMHRGVQESKTKLPKEGSINRPDPTVGRGL